MSAPAEMFDLIVIGAGINGAGMFRDAALRGLRVLLLDKGDIGSGTTATSSRLIHGGLRYLEHFEFPLVRESLRERERLLRTAPHLVAPLSLTVPIYRSHKRGPAMITLGMIAYDLLSYDKSLPLSRMYTREQVLAQEPGLESGGLLAAANYFDAQCVYPERLSLVNVLDGLAHGGDLLTYADVVGLEQRGDQAWNVRVRLGTEEREFAGRAVINVAGPWIDDVLDLAGDFPRYNGGTKGSHIVVEPFPGAPTGALYIEARQDGRPYFIIPWNNLYLIGTTDLRYDGSLDRVVATEEEIQYLITETNLAIPEASLSRDDVLYTFSGVRPLPYQAEGSTGAITRKHIIQSHGNEADGLYSIIGGKLTTYRSLAEEAVDDVERALKGSVDGHPTRTAMLPGASADYDGDVARFLETRPAWLGDAAANWLVDVYGMTAKDIVEFSEVNTRLQEPIWDGHPAIIGALAWSFERERALTLSDVMLRRTMLALEADSGIGVGESASYVAQELYGWEEDYRVAQLNDFHREVSELLPRDFQQ